MTPYYEQDGITIYHGDCREVLPSLGPVDAVVTDPPYGIGFEYASHDDNIDGWVNLMNDVIPLAKMSAPVVVMPSCAIRRLGWWYANHPPDWVIAWYKGSPGHQSHIGFNDWEPHLIWGKPAKPIHDYFATRCGFDPNGHPCPKPIEWARWLVARVCPDGGTVTDTFMGSGTTLVAAKNLGRKAIGIEIEERYCEIAAKRLAQRELFGGVAA
jgi:site-specific DNA-methyltransferase (adenine-specific)